MIDLALAFSISAAVVYWMLKPQKQYTHSEWLEAMRKQKLGTK